MTTVKEHRRKRRNKVSVVRRHNRKDKVSAYRGAKEFSDASREKLSQKWRRFLTVRFPLRTRGIWRMPYLHTAVPRIPR